MDGLEFAFNLDPRFPLFFSKFPLDLASLGWCGIAFQDIPTPFYV